MKQGLIKTALAVAITLSLAACGGGGDAGPQASSSPPSVGTPSATISATSAQALAAAAKSGAQAAGKTKAMDGIPLPTLVAPPISITGSGSLSCPFGGNASYNVHISRVGYLTAGDSITRSLSSCAFVQNDVLNGSVGVGIARATAADDFAIDLTATNLSETVNGYTHGPFNLLAHIDVNKTVVSYTFSVDGTTIVGQPSLTITGSTSGLVSSGTVHAGLGDGWVAVSYTNWQYNPSTGLPSAGTAHVRGASGNTATVTVEGGQYQVVTVVNGMSVTTWLPIV